MTDSLTPEAGPARADASAARTAVPSHADPELVSNHEDPRAAAKDRAAIRKRLAAERPPCQCETLHNHCYAVACLCPIHGEEVGHA
ncbi:hypothetical protein OHR68_09860 [Spirillospora sp. NBC_00431]